MEDEYVIVVIDVRGNLLAVVALDDVLNPQYTIQDLRDYYFSDNPFKQITIYKVKVKTLEQITA